MHEMENINELKKLKDLKDQKTRELASLTREETTTTGADAVRDILGTSDTYETYTDSKRAFQLMDEIKEIEEEIKKFPIMESVRKSDNISKSLDKVIVGKIISFSKEQYNSDVNEYMNKKFWDKAKTMFSGKKPKIGATGEEIMGTYAEESKNVEMQYALKNENDAYRALTDWIKAYYEKYPDRLGGSSIEEVLDFEKNEHEKRIKEIEDRYNGYLDEANEVVRSGVVKL